MAKHVFLYSMYIFLNSHISCVCLISADVFFKLANGKREHVLENKTSLSTFLDQRMIQVKCQILSDFAVIQLEF